MGRFPLAFVQSFLERLVERPAPAHLAGRGPCQIWTGAEGGDGYGNISVDGRTERTHLVGFEVYHGRQPRGEVVRHLCGRRLCCAGRHLVEGTHQENLADQVAHGTYSPPPHPCGASHPGSKLSDADMSHLWTMDEHGYSQQEIAEALHVSQPLVSAILNGKARTCGRG